MTDKEKRDKAVDEFAAAMKERLDWAHDAKGHRGWDGSYDGDALRDEILDDAAELYSPVDFSLRCVDIAARSMFLRWRVQNGVE